MKSTTTSHGEALGRVETVLVGASLGAENDWLLQSALELAAALGARTYVAHAAPLEPLSPRLGAGWAESDYFRELTQARWAELRRRLERLEVPPGPRIESFVRTGAPHWVLASTAREVGADLIVVGASEKPHGLGRVLGSTAERVLRRAECPVLVLRAPHELPWNRVLAPVDLSMHSGDSLRCGLSFLSQLETAEPSVRGVLVLPELQRSLLEDLTSAERVDAFAQRELERFVEELVIDESFGVETQVRTGEPRAEILAEAENWDADLIVIGTHGWSGLERAMIGSVASGVVGKASTSVLVIPPLTALGASIAQAVYEQTEPHWPAPEAPVATTREEGNP